MPQRDTKDRFVKSKAPQSKPTAAMYGAGVSDREDYPEGYTDGLAPAVIAGFVMAFALIAVAFLCVLNY